MAANLYIQKSYSPLLNFQIINNSTKRMFATKFAKNRNLVRCFSNFTANPNSTFPTFTPKDNSTGSVNWDLHNKENWSIDEVN
jgi:hypothetical protein